jgi:hypothetical protein
MVVAVWPENKEHNLSKAEKNRKKIKCFVFFMEISKSTQNYVFYKKKPKHACLLFEFLNLFKNKWLPNFCIAANCKRKFYWII